MVNLRAFVSLISFPNYLYSLLHKAEKSTVYNDTLHYDLSVKLAVYRRQKGKLVVHNGQRSSKAASFSKINPQRANCLALWQAVKISSSLVT